MIRYSLTYCIVRKGEKTLPHYLDHSEVYYILDGEGIMHIRKQDELPEKEETSHVTKNQAIFKIGFHL